MTGRQHVVFGPIKHSRHVTLPSPAGGGFSLSVPRLQITWRWVEASECAAIMSPRAGAIESSVDGGQLRESTRTRGASLGVRRHYRYEEPSGRPSFRAWTILPRLDGQPTEIPGKTPNSAIGLGAVGPRLTSQSVEKPAGASEVFNRLIELTTLISIGLALPRNHWAIWIGARTTRLRFLLLWPQHGKSMLQLRRIALVCWLTLPLHIVGAKAIAGDVAVLLSAPAPAYRSAVKAFTASCRHQVKVEYDIRGDLDRGRRLVHRIVTVDKPDLILAVGPWALRVATESNTTLPVVYTMVVNPASYVDPGFPSVVCGASMNVAPNDTFGALLELDSTIKRVGVVFSEKHTGQLVKRARASAKELGIELVAEPVQSKKRVVAALSTVQAKGVDAFWIVPDACVLDRRIVQQFLLLAFRSKVPVVGLSAAHAEMGAPIAVSFADVEDLGSHAGTMANQILSGKQPAPTVLEFARKTKITLNLKSTRRLGITVSEQLRARASRCID